MEKVWRAIFWHMKIFFLLETCLAQLKHDIKSLKSDQVKFFLFLKRNKMQLNLRLIFEGKIEKKLVKLISNNN